MLLTLKFHLLEQMVGIDNENYLIDVRVGVYTYDFTVTPLYTEKLSIFLTGITYIVLTEITFIKI